VYQTCPKCGHERARDDATPLDRCAACGVLFEKWLRSRLRAGARARGKEAAPGAGARERLATRTLALLLHVESQVNPLVFWARVLVYLGLVAWGVYFIVTDWAGESGISREIGESFMHRVNLVFHEAGHVLFIPFGDFMSVLGGSLGQLIMPLVVLLVFLLREHNTFAASVGLWWLAQSLMDLAPYIGDARAQQLLLLGGVTGADAPGYHDWRNILGRLDLLHHDRAFATMVDTTGELLMLAAFAWGGAVLWRQWQHLDRRF
jgi:hypothetical protein